MNPSPRFLSPAEAARRLGVSAKALRLYEQRGLIAPTRTAAGWRAYGPAQLQRGADIVALRALGLSLAQVGGVLQGQPQDLAPALAAHQAVLEQRWRQLSGTIDMVRGLRAGLARGRQPSLAELTSLQAPANGAGIAFDLPWPWGGEPFCLDGIGRLTYIVGPLGSGKTRLALRLSEVLPGAAFMGVDRLQGHGATDHLAADASLRGRVDEALAWLEGDGARPSDALLALLARLHAAEPATWVIDMVEQGLDAATQRALAAYLRRRRPPTRPLVMLTRSSAFLDLAAVGEDEAIILCPANHSPPTLVAPSPGSPGYEAVATCLAPPHVRARTEGVIAWRPDQAADYKAVRTDQISGNSTTSSILRK